ncbi:MAG TPA: metal-dependent hydrolase [Puia sp.]|nr:metal-dependent hydrolase [Puia sp.]
MDSLTHIVLGAIIGEAMAGRKLGKKAMLLGAVAQSLPDIDFVASSWLDTSRDVLAHRGITHSFLFVLLAGIALALLAERLGRRRTRKGAGAGAELGSGEHAADVGRGVGSGGLSLRGWLFFFCLQLFVHIFLDAFNAYGTGWFEPFSHYRVSFNVLFVADPFYSVWLGISFLALLILKRDSRARKFWMRFGLLVSSFYLYYCVMNKYKVDKLVKKELARQQIAYTRYLTSPTPFNNWLWYIVAEDKNGYDVGYYSLFDRHGSIAFHFFPRNDSLLTPVRGREDVQNLLRFAEGYYTVERWKDVLVFSDLRFGQMKGWEYPDAHFVFHYFLERPGDNMVILQRGRFAGWDKHAVEAFIRRIGGN